MKVRLGDFIKEYSVRNKAGEDIPVFSVTNTQGFCRDYFGKDVSSKDRTTYKIVPKGYFAYNPSRINVGSVDWQRHEDRVIVSPLYNVFSVSPELDQQYLYYYLKSDIGLFYIKAAATGSVRDNLKLAMLADFHINLPSIEEQRAIVEKLDRIKEIINLYNQELQTLDELVKARFVEMFGDTNHPENTLLNLCNIIDYRGKTPEKVDSGLPFITAKNVKMHYMTMEPREYISKETYDKVMTRGFPKEGDVVFTTEAPLGNVCRIPRFDTEFYIGQRIVTMQTEILNPIYLEYALSDESFKRKYMSKSSGSTVTGIRVRLLEQLTIPVPPIELQNEFAEFVKEVDKSKVVGQMVAKKM